MAFPMKAATVAVGLTFPLLFALYPVYVDGVRPDDADLRPMSSIQLAFLSSGLTCGLAGTWLLLVTGGGPTADKPGVVFTPPIDPDQVSHAMTLRVADCRAAYEALRARGADFLTAPHDWGAEIRCFLRDPDGHLVELSQAAGG